MECYHLSLTRHTNVCQNLPENVLPKLISYVAFYHKMQTNNKYNLISIFAADETAVWFNMLSETTVHTTGAKQVSI